VDGDVEDAEANGGEAGDEGGGAAAVEVQGVDGAEAL
jgi:hypothetical protein